MRPKSTKTLNLSRALPRKEEHRAYLFPDFASGLAAMHQAQRLGLPHLHLRLSDDDESVLADVFVAAPHDERLTTNTVFWDTSGFSVSLGAQGVQLNMNSFASVLQGGAEFTTITSGGAPVEAVQS